MSRSDPPSTQAKRGGTLGQRDPLIYPHHSMRWCRAPRDTDALPEGEPKEPEHPVKQQALRRASFSPHSPLSGPLNLSTTFVAANRHRQPTPLRCAPRTRVVLITPFGACSHVTDFDGRASTTKSSCSGHETREAQASGLQPAPQRRARNRSRNRRCGWRAANQPASLTAPYGLFVPNSAYWAFGSVDRVG
jgi:hypothetical protein